MKRNQQIIQWRRRETWTRLLKILMLAGLVFTCLALLALYRINSTLPEYAELREIRSHEASSVHTSDGQLLGRYYLQNRDRVGLDEITPEFLDALLAIEDIRFHKHNGLDYRALGRVFVRTILLRQNAGGGSTITQQLTKNLYPREGDGPAANYVDKLREIMIALRLERLYTKEEILELYVNTVSFGEDTWGIKTASERFFNTTPCRLELHQAATLAGMLRATTWYNPRRNPENALYRRNLVIHQMERYGMIDPVTSEKMRNRPLDLDYNRRSWGEGRAPHFRAYLRAQLRHILSTQKALDGRQYDLFTDGLVIETTIDSRLQTAAEHAIQTHLAELQTAFDDSRDHEPVFESDDPLVHRAWVHSDRYRSMKQRGYSDEEVEKVLDEPVPMDLFTWEGEVTDTISPRDSIRYYLSIINAGFLAMHPETGDIKAWAGGIPDRRFQYDQVRARRQTGSAFKPVVYAGAIESGIEPCDYRRNLLSTYVAHDHWTPSNLQQEYGGHYSIQAALSRSVNTVSVELLMETGIEKIRETARMMGIQSHIPAIPSIALGTAELSLLEMTRAYSTFANRGIPVTPRFIKAIYNAGGELIYDFSKPADDKLNTTHDFSEPVFSVTELEDYLQTDNYLQVPDITGEPVISENTAATMMVMLSRSVDSGSASRLRTQYGITHAVAGKTGTTQNYSDGWFIGLAPGLVFGSRVGGITPRVQLPEHMGFASQTALPIAGLFLQQRQQYPWPESLPDRFYSYQTDTDFSTDCDDYREERFTDRVRDFISGRDSGEPQIVEEEESRSIFRRIRNLFSSD